MSNLDPHLIKRVILEVLGEISQDQTRPSPSGVSSVFHRPRISHAPGPFAPKALAQIKAASPSRLAQGRTGTRYLTDTYIQLRAEHAIALDAVHSTIPDALPPALGCISCASRAQNLDDFLLYPDQGRRLNDASRALLEREGSRNADVLLICGDGLSPWALTANGPTHMPALTRELTAAGFKLGKPIFVKHARVGIQDDIGTLLGAKSTVILVGERPGLGSGDSLSIYTAFNPRLNQDNAEKDCISNIRPLGIPPEEAARECALLLQRTFKAGGGGVHLTRSGL
jgi:ethanolamine ammonia-lyase small subunit